MSGEGGFTVVDGRRFEAILRAQQNLFTLDQAKSCGITARQVQRRCHNQLWCRIHAGVFAAQPSPLTYEQALRAALLIGGPHAALSTSTAARLHGLWMFAAREDKSPPTRIEVVVPRGAPARDVKVNEWTLSFWRSRDLEPHDITVKHGLRCTTPPRTLIDLAETAQRRLVVPIFEDLIARGHRHWLAGRLEKLRRGRRGLDLLDELLARRDGRGPPCESPGEALLDDLLWRAGLRATRQHELWHEGRLLARIDLAFIPQRVSVEFDGDSTHNNDFAFVKDRRRDGQFLADLDWVPLRFTWDEVWTGKGVVERVRTLLARRSRQLGVPLHEYRATEQQDFLFCREECNGYLAAA